MTCRQARAFIRAAGWTCQVARQLMGNYRFWVTKRDKSARYTSVAESYKEALLLAVHTIQQDQEGLNDG